GMSYLVCRETYQENKKCIQDCIQRKLEPLVMIAKAVLESPNCSSEAVMSCSLACAAYDVMCRELGSFANDKPTPDSAVRDSIFIYSNLLECLSCLHLMRGWHVEIGNMEGDPKNSDTICHVEERIVLSLQQCVTDLKNQHNGYSDTFTSACLLGITDHAHYAQQCLQSLNTDSMVNPGESHILVAACRNALQDIVDRCDKCVRERSIEYIGQSEHTPGSGVATLLTHILTSRSAVLLKAGGGALFPPGH
ncbi:hypothetical protein, partial [Anaplasma phagocytophilum]|uniref:hypothetical protein n=1 Tax=Anaplasma phagocytophilum TaxID=948 RepID=UPI00201AF5CD